MATLNPGDRLAGRFLLVRRLGAGAATECWLAEDVAERARRVLKIATEPADQALLAAEATLLAECADPGIVAAHGLQDDGPRRLLVLEYLPGGDLTALRGGPWRASVTALGPALAALERLHARGQAHGDLKPANLVRGADGAARLVDFGVAAAARAGLASRGSPYARSPAQWQGAAPAPADDLYGLGALLYELVSGAPPFYPSVDAAAAATRVPPPPAGAPAALAALIARLLAKAPAERGDVASARAALAALLAAEAEAPVPRAPPVVLAPPPRPLAAPAWQPAPPAAARGAETGPARAPRGLAIAGALAAAALLVFVVLPRWAERHPPSVSVAPTVASPILAAREAAAPKALPSTPEGLADLAKAKTRAEEARTHYEAQAAPLAAAHAELWGGAAHARMTAAAAEATARYTERDYAAAAVGWTGAAAAAAEVSRARAPALAAALAAGNRAFEHGDAAAASAAFERALAIEPADRSATAGLARARHLDAVLALLDAGAALEKSGDLDGATAKYRAALALDPATQAASAALARLGARARSNAFAAAMAQGQKALAGGDRAAARSAFERAGALAPGSTEVRDALAALAVGEQDATLARLRATAEAAVREERWADAVKAYDQALALDTTLVFAQAGRATALPRAELAARLERFAAAPERLHSPDGRSEARAVLAAAADPAVAGGAVLRRQVAALEAALAVAETPVHVALVSDNLTEVTVYRVARLGAFAAHELDLLPGRYTIVGRRVGFRDVRREVEIGPGAGGAAPIDIRCTDPI